jgi:hypothetical protein
MKMQITIIYFLISFLNASSQIAVPADTTIWTFTVEHDNTWSFTTPSTVKKFKVLSSNYKLPISSFFIANMKDLPKNPFGIKTFKVQGQVISRTEWVYGPLSFSAGREETRTYVKPVYFALNLTTSQDNQK